VTKTIWKVPHDSPGTQHKIGLPKGSLYLSTITQSVDLKTEHLVSWFLVDADVELEIRQFTIVGTGWPLQDDPGDYLATVMQRKDLLIWHLFEVTRKVEATNGANYANVSAY